MSLKVCSVEECGRPHKARGWCNKHYTEWLNNNAPPCSVEGCERLSQKRGWCETHYMRWYRNKTLKSRSYHFSTEDAFQEDIEPSGDCIIWTGGKDRKGYGTIRAYGKSYKVHRYAWEREKGPIPDGMHIDHICHNPSCVKVEHLRLATFHQNGANRSGPMLDTVSGIRNVYPSKNRWQVKVMKHGVSHYIGHFEHIEEAAAAAKRARKELFKEYAGKG